MLLTNSEGPSEYDFLTMITIKYVDSETGEEATVSFNTRTANFTHSQILEIIKKFQNKKSKCFATGFLGFAYICLISKTPCTVKTPAVS